MLNDSAAAEDITINVAEFTHDPKSRTFFESLQTRLAKLMEENPFKQYRCKQFRKVEYKGGCCPQASPELPVRPPTI
ncbi:hypothetical protein ACTXT7_013330 [Hymenolepis weldensis]